MSGFLMIGLIGVIIAGLINFFLRSPIMYFVISAVTAVVFGGFLMVDMQRTRDARGGTGDAIMLAIAIYLDIFNLFLSILQIFGFLGGRDD
jgi:FtsH-binding integral membrane protein